VTAALLDPPEPTSGLARFWQWWTDELRALMPRRRRDPLLRKAVILVGDGLGFRVIVRRGSDPVDMGRLDQPRPSRIDIKRGVSDPRLVPDEQSIALAGRINRSGLPVVLRLPATEGLVAHDELPAAAERHLQDVIGHRVDVLTPWTAEQVAFDTRVIGRLPEQGRIQVEAAFAPRDTVQRLGALLASFGVRPAVVDIAGRSVDDLPRIDLLQGTGRRRSRFGMLVLVSLAIALPVLSAALFYDVWQRSFLVEERQQQELVLAGRMEEVAAAQAQRMQALADANFLHARRAERPSPLVALEIVARELPGDAWLSRFELSGNKITMSGEASEAPRVLALIGADKRFSNAALGSSSTRGPSTAPELFGMPVDRFTLNALLDPNAMVEPLPPVSEESLLEPGPEGLDLEESLDPADEGGPP
jgi:general secretion pathway protein L